MNTWLAVSVVLLWVVVLGLAVMNAVLFRQLGIMVMGSARGIESSGVPVGKRPPQDRLAAIDATDWAPGDWRGSRFLIFCGGTYCSDCASLIPTLKEMHGAGLRLVTLMFFDTHDELRSYVGEHSFPGVVIPTSQELGHNYDVVAVPFAYAIDERGVVVGKGLAGNRQRLLELSAACGVTIPSAPDSVAASAVTG